MHSTFCRRHLSFVPLWYDTRTDVRLCWIGPTNCQPKWLRTSLEVQRYGMKKNTFESFTVDPIMPEDELWMRQREKSSPNCQSWFLNTKLRIQSFRFLNLEVSSLRFGFRKLIWYFHQVPHTPNYTIQYNTIQYNTIIKTLSRTAVDCSRIWGTGSRRAGKGGLYVAGS